METFTELKSMLTDYARQETRDPFKLLGKWVAFGVAGALLVAIGLGYLAFGLLRWTQSLDAFSGDTRDFWPYFIAFGGLVVCTTLAVWAMTRRFSNGDDA
jgi:hypothetical protein